MKHKILAATAVAGLSLTLGATSASAAPPAGAGVPAGIQCQQEGIGILRSLGLLDDAARDGVTVVGVGTIAFPEVLQLHREDVGLFQSGPRGVSVVIPGATVPATWCDGVGA